MYNLLSHGRRMYRSLVYTSAARFSLRAMKPCHMKDSSKAVPACTRFSAGDWKGYRQEEPSLVVRRLNASLGGREVLLPSRLLYGVLPSALLEAFRFWQGEDMVRPPTHRSQLVQPRLQIFLATNSLRVPTLTSPRSYSSLPTR